MSPDSQPETMQHRVTMQFHSDRGREYLYDDVTGCIFPWNELREAVLSHCLSGTHPENQASLVAKYGTSNLEATYHFVSRWRDRYGAFARAWSDSDLVSCPPAEELAQLISTRSFELLLILTENCNLRCKYCGLSEVYPLSRNRTARTMTIDTAKRAVDWYVQLVKAQITQNPRKRFGLSLYGGEPMMNMLVLERILEYCRHKYPGTFLPVITTNGTLLTSNNIEALVRNDVRLAISIDGPQQEHDRMRVVARNRGTFQRIAAGLRRLKQDHPDYWAANVVSVSVYDYGTDLDAVEKFFEENEDILPRTVFVIPVSPYNTSWYTRYTESDRRSTTAAIDRLRQRYKDAKIQGHKTSHYNTCISGMGITMALLRRRVGDDRTAFIPFTGTCVPGDKIAVQVDGKLDMCERVNGTYPIGHLDRGGIEYERLRETIRKYQRQVLASCCRCPATKHCNVCFSFVEKDADFLKSADMCADIIRNSMQTMGDYVSIGEENPNADFAFETDTSRFQERVLFRY